MVIINKQTTQTVRHPQTQQSSLYQQWPERARANQEPKVVQKAKAVLY